MARPPAVAKHPVTGTGESALAVGERRTAPAPGPLGVFHEAGGPALGRFLPIREAKDALRELLGQLFARGGQ